MRAVPFRCESRPYRRVSQVGRRISFCVSLSRASRFLHHEIDRCTFFEGLSFARQADLAIRDRLAVLLERCVRQTHKTGTRHPAEHFLERVAAQLVAWEQLGVQATGGSRAAGLKLIDDTE